MFARKVGVTGGHNLTKAFIVTVHETAHRVYSKLQGKFFGSTNEVLGHLIRPGTTRRTQLILLDSSLKKGKFMAQVTGQAPKENRMAQLFSTWLQRLKTWLGYLAFAAIAFLIGLYIVAPRIEHNRANYLPETFTKLPTGIVQITTETGSTMLPVRIADTTQARSSGLRAVGSTAFDNTFVLFVQSRETTSRSTYNFTGVRVPLEVAVINAAGKVLSVQSVPLTTPSLTVAENHTWLLVAKSGAFEPYGIKVDSVLDPATIRKLNL